MVSGGRCNLGCYTGFRGGVIWGATLVSVGVGGFWGITLVTGGGGGGFWVGTLVSGGGGRQAWGEYWSKVLEYKYKYLKK